MRFHSITRRLISAVLLIELVAAVGVSCIAFEYERHAHFRAFDVLLRGRADSLLGAVQDAEDANDNVMLDGSESRLPKEDIYQVLDDTGRVIGQSDQWADIEISSEKRPERLRSERLRSGGSRPEGSRAQPPDGTVFYEANVHRQRYRVIAIRGLRVVDPGDKGGGVHRYVTIAYGSSDRPVWGAVIQAVGFLATGNLLVLIGTGVVMSLVLKRGLAPLRALAASASTVSVASWEFTPPELARETEELAPLVVALERVLSGLESSFDQQKRFVGDAAHELKTSAAVVKSSLQLLVMKQRNAAEYQAGVERCLADCERMESIVAQMLMLAYVDESRAAGPANQTETAEALNEVVTELRTMADIKEIGLVLKTSPVLWVDIEPEQFQLLCTNVLTNAIQHSSSGSVIEIELRRDAGLVILCIEDSGEGIPAESLPYIFERFFRSDPSRSRKTGGTGLGLAICKAIVSKARGTIEVQSTVNTGTTVLVKLPASRA